MRFDNATTYSYAGEAAQASFVTKVYGWMSAGLLLTALTALYTANSPALLQLVFGNQMVFLGLIIGELALVWFISGMVQRISGAAATMLFLLYAAVNGLTLSVIFLAYTHASIAATFFVTSATFGSACLFGTVTRMDLSRWGGILFLGVIGIIIATIVNIFLANTVLDGIINYAGVLIFTGLAAYDSQKIKRMSDAGFTSQGAAICGALALYLDFINLFLFLLRLFGQRR